MGPMHSSPQGGEKMKKYEVMFIIDPTLEDAQKDATVETVKVSSLPKAKLRT